MKYIVYKTVNVINGKTYIGCHKTNNLDDGYMGSGKYLKRAIEKYGVENFHKDILEVFDTPEEMFEMEAILVNEDFIGRRDTYNLKLGGEGGFDYINKTSNREHRDKCGEIGKSNFLRGTELVDFLVENGRYGEILTKLSNRMKGNKYWVGKRHTEESKQKIASANRKNVGEKNSQYGTCWIYHPELMENKKIDKTLLDEYTQQGWIKGKKIKN